MMCAGSEAGKEVCTSTTALPKHCGCGAFARAPLRAGCGRLRAYAAYARAVQRVPGMPPQIIGCQACQIQAG